MTLEQEFVAKRALVAAARTMLSMQVGLSVGALRVAALLRQAGGGAANEHRIFAEFASAIPPDVPVGTARLYWAPHALLERDAVLADIEAGYRARLLQECIEIIACYKPEVQARPAISRAIALVFSA